MACLASLQAMPGILRVFGYPDPNLRGGYGIDVRQFYLPPNHNRSANDSRTTNISTADRILVDLGAFLSSILAGAVAHFFGRKPALWLACLLIAAGAAIQIGHQLERSGLGSYQ
jgi:hypothetical protein